MKFFNFLKKEKVDDVEEEFKAGRILLPTGIRDYEDFSEFKSKTKHLPNIQDQLNSIEENKSNGE